MIKEDIKFKDSTVFEGMTSIRAIIKARELKINDRKINTILYDKDKYKNIAKNVGYLKAVSSIHGFEVIESNAEELEKITLGTSHGGIVALAEERTIPYLSVDTSLKKNGFYCMIQGIEDPYNFGYALRSLYACGCDGIILAERNWMSAAGVVARSSAGASELFEIYKGDPVEIANIFKKQGFSILCADEDTDNILGKCDISCPVLLIVGGEKRGISKDLLSLADMRVKIEYARDFSASLSAASATTMFAYEIMRLNHK